MAYKKSVIYSEKISGKKIKIKKTKDISKDITVEFENEEEIFLEFDNDVDYTIEKLSLDELPAKTSEEHDIVWMNNFSIRDSRGDYVNGVDYYVSMPIIAGKPKIVYFDGVTVQEYKDTVQDVTENGKAMKRFKLKIGDPASGWTN